MKVVIVTGGRAPAYGQVKHEFTHANLVIAADSGLELLHGWGVKPHLIIGDFDSLQDKALLEAYPKESILQSAVEKDYSDTELALQEAWKRVALQREAVYRGAVATSADNITGSMGITDEVILIGGGEGRLDHTLALVSLFMGDLDPSCGATTSFFDATIDPPTRWYTAYEVVYTLYKGGHVLAGCSNQTISFFPMKHPCSARSEGLYWELEHMQKVSLPFSLSNRMVQECVSVFVEQGAFLAIQSLDSCPIVK